MRKNHTNWTEAVAVPQSDEDGYPYYYFIEYVKETDIDLTTTATIDLKNGAQHCVSENDARDDRVLSLTNELEETPVPETVDINIRKLDEKGDGLADAVFQVRVKNTQSAYQAIADLTDQADIAKYQGISTSVGPLETKNIGAKNGSGGVLTKSTFTTTSGTLMLTGLADGDYQLIEVEAPDGYVVLLKEIEFSVSDGVVSGTDIEGKVRFFQNTAVIEITNTPGAKLPSTGGPGTRLLYLAGLLLMAIAGLGFAMTRRKTTL